MVHDNPLQFMTVHVKYNRLYLINSEDCKTDYSIHLAGNPLY